MERQPWVTGSCVSCSGINDSQGWLAMIFNLLFFIIQLLNIEIVVSQIDNTPCPSYIRLVPWDPGPWLK